MVLFFLLAIGAGSQDSPPDTVARGRMSEIDDRREIAIRDPKTWEALWTEHSRLATLPDVDFETDMVVGMFLGTRPTAGYDVTIASVTIDDDGLVVRYVERSPEPGMMVAQMLSSPFHLVRVPRHEGEVRFTPDGVK